jgi:HK97 family phage major capsid protein
MKKSILMPSVCLAALMAEPPVFVSGPVMNDVDTDTEKLFEVVNEQLEKLGSEVKQTAEKAISETIKFGKMTEETKVAADKALTEQTVLNKSFEKLKAMVEGLDSKHTDLSQQVAEGGKVGGSVSQSLGQAVVAQEDKIKKFAENSFSGSLTLKVENAITTAAGSGGGLIFPEEERTPVIMARRRLLIRQLLTTGRTGTNVVAYAKQTLRDSQAGMTAEEAASAESSYGYSKATTNVKKIAHHTNISEETVADSQLLQTEVDGEMRYGLDLEEDKQILSGDGIGDNLSGLLTQAPAFVAAAGLPDANPIDRLRLALLQIVLEDYIPGGFILNPTDWAKIDLLKVGASDDRYVFGNPGAQTLPMLWGKDVVESNTMSINEFVAGDFQMAATVYDRSDAEVLISSEHGTNFIEDMLTMKATKRLALAIKRPMALCQGNFTFV